VRRLGFYRPDPSYLPAIEQHINELRADRETALAMGAAEFITTALTAQITAYQRVIDRMHKHLGSLPEPGPAGGRLHPHRRLGGRPPPLLRLDRSHTPAC
jgi:hypothetical protein